MNACEPPVTADAAVERLHPWMADRLLPLDPRPPRPSASRLVAAAVLVGLTPRAHGVQVILTRRADTLRSHSGQIAFPGGRIEPGETVGAAAMREAHEEIGLEPRFVRPLGLSDGHVTGTGFEITPMVAIVSPGFALAPSAAEVAEVFEAPFAVLMDLANYEARAVEGPAGPRDVYATTYGGREIWGATAALLRELSLRLFAPRPISPRSRRRGAAGR